MNTRAHETATQTMSNSSDFASSASPTPWADAIPGTSRDATSAKETVRPSLFVIEDPP